MKHCVSADNFLDARPLYVEVFIAIFFYRSRIILMINWNARYDEVIIGDVEEEEKEKRSLTLIGDGVAYCDTLMYGFDKWIIEKMDFTKGVNEKLK